MEDFSVLESGQLLLFSFATAFAVRKSPPLDKILQSTPHNFGCAPYPSWALSDKSSGSYLSARRADIKFCKQDYTANNGQALKPLYIIISAAILANLISLYFYFSLHRLTQITHCKLWYQLQHEWLKYISREATVSNISFTYQKASGYATDTIKTGLLWSYHSRTKPKPCLIHI